LHSRHIMPPGRALSGGLARTVLPDLPVSPRRSLINARMSDSPSTPRTCRCLSELPGGTNLVISNCASHRRTGLYSIASRESSAFLLGE